MSKKDFHVEATAENLTKMEDICKAHRRRMTRLQKAIHRAEVRLKGATRDVLKRRFAYDIKQLTEQLENVRGKEAWARRMIDAIKMAQSCDSDGNLKQNPFAAALAGIKVG